MEMLRNPKRKFELDVAVDAIPLEESLEFLKNSVSKLKVLEVIKEGRGTGWPTIIVELPESSMNELKMWYEGVDRVEDCEIEDADWSEWEL